MTSTEPATGRERFSRVYYGPRARAAHLLSSRSVMNFAVCGVYAGTSAGWLGTGSQDERDHAAALPLCEDCAKETDF